MKVTHHFKGTTDDEKLAIYYNILKMLANTKEGEELQDESTLCETVNRQERQHVD